MENKQEIENKEETINKEAESLKDKSGKSRTTPFFIILCLLMAGLTVFTALTAFRTGGENKALAEKVDALSGSVGRLSDRVKQSMGIYEPEDESEDDIVIAGQFKIQSTLPISDAYKSGDTSALDDRQKETLAMASEVLDKIITDGMSDYEKEYAVYIWLTTQMENETGHLTVISTAADDSGNPYGVLKYRKAVCAGYATTFRLFMQMMGIDCKVVHSNERGHSWDLVNLDGDWYHVDCYMDSGTGNCRNFNMNDGACAIGHEWCREYFPKAEGEKYSYAMMNSTELDSFYDIPTWAKGLIEDEKSVGSCYFKQRIAPEDEAAAAHLADTLVETLGNSEMYGSEMYFEKTWSESDERGYVFTLYIQKSGEDDPVEDVDPEIEKKINASIVDAFGEDIFIVNYYDGEEEYGNALVDDMITIKG